jgi:hypothetical protein
MQGIWPCSTALIQASCFRGVGQLVEEHRLAEAAQGVSTSLGAGRRAIARAGTSNVASS